MAAIVAGCREDNQHVVRDVRGERTCHMDEKELDDILAAHRKWLDGEDGGERADLRNADLRNADLSNAHLSYADLSNAELRYADLSNADLSYADLSNADLRYAKNIPPLVEAVTSILPAGEIVGWKIAHGALVKLSIPADARRSNATGRKCRCDKATVLSITKYGEEVESAISDHDADFVYRVGETVTPDSFDEDRWDVCSHGIHFFITKEEALDYASRQ